MLCKSHLRLDIIKKYKRVKNREFSAIVNIIVLRLQLFDDKRIVYEVLTYHNRRGW
jgi:hypothetical protein